jgi:hypothetical protein
LTTYELGQRAVYAQARVGGWTEKESGCGVRDVRTGSDRRASYSLLCVRLLLGHRVERATEVPILLLAITFLVAVAAPELFDLSSALDAGLEAVTWMPRGVERITAHSSYLAHSAHASPLLSPPSS